MKFDYINDVHLDFWAPFNENQDKFEKNTRKFALSLIPESFSCTLVIGGDLGHFNKQNYWFLSELSAVYRRILLVFGNHDYYLISNNQSSKYKRSSFNRIKEMKDLASTIPNVSYLEGDMMDIEGVCFGGTGMWYDFQYGQQTHNQTKDEVRILWSQHSKDFKKIKGLLTLDHFESELERLDTIIKKSDVIVTHVGPNWGLSPYIGFEERHNSYYFFDGSDFLQAYQNKVWCHGHIHTELDVKREGWRFISYALGYPDETPFKKFRQIEI